MEREHADLTASEVPDALGLSYGVSRAQLWKQLHQGADRAPASSRLQELWAYGRAQEPISLSAYNDIFKKHVFKFDGNFNRPLSPHPYRLFATPDAWDISHPVEIKSVSEYGHVPDKPKAAHVIQCVVQMYCSHSQHAYLFYYKFLTGEYACFKIVWDEEAWEDWVRLWLLEFLEAGPDGPKRMKSGEAERRSKFILDHFLDGAHAGATPPEGLGSCGSPDEADGAGELRGRARQKV